MNGKQARALRRVKEDRPKLADIQLLQRKLMHQEMQMRFVKRPKKLRVNKPAKSHGPTWPATRNQDNQSRPVIVVKPIRAMKMEIMSYRKFQAQDAAFLKSLNYLPKWRLDMGYQSIRHLR